MTEINWKDKLRDMAKQLKVKNKDLLALTPQYDPFYIENEANHKKGKWAKELLAWVLEKWNERKKELEKIGIIVGNMPHLRAIHYLLVTGHPNPIKWDGKRYVGSYSEWAKLQGCFKYAKILKYIPFGVIEDHKHPQIIKNLYRDDDINLNSPEYKEISQIFTTNDVRVYLPKADIRDKLKIETIIFDELEKLNKAVNKDIQGRIPVHIEIWTEKQRELVDLIAKEYWVNVQNAVGQQSYENIYSLLNRAIEDSGNKPLRIIFLSDYDPRGEMTMPVGVSRLVEWMLYHLDEFKGHDVKLKKLMLTEEQVIKYELPHAPVKETESMKKRWKKERGEGVVEIDAIETLFAVEMVSILREELERYVPKNITDKIDEFNKKLIRTIEEYNTLLDQKIENTFWDFEEKIREVIKPAIKDFEETITIDVTSEYERVKELENDWKEPDWEVNDGNDNDWLYDSKRNYIEQMEYYKKIRGKD